ncbi:MAG: response regulator [Gemmatimonadota bacterium]|nr:response regulator [Gemmatimonadota bacterium]
MTDTEPSGSQTTPRADTTGVQTLARLVEYLRDGCIFVGYDMRVAFLNSAARRDAVSRGEQPDLYRGGDLWAILQYPPDSTARLAVERAARERVPTYFTTRGSHGDYWVEVDVVPLDEGCLIYYRDATARSVAEGARVASESELKLTSERLRVLLVDAPLAVYVIDQQANVLHWNLAAEQMFQWKADEVIGKALPFVPEDEREGFEINIAKARGGGSLAAKPERRHRKDGVVLDVQVSSSPMRDQTGQVVGTIAMAMDVTSQRKLEMQLRMAQKMEAVGLLAGGVAHDFNNLLTAIKGFSSLLQMTVQPDDQSFEFLDEINKAADRAAALTAQLLAFSRQQLLRPEPMDLNARVTDLERMLRMLLREHGVLTLSLASDLHRVLADPGQIEQVILNLVVNARDAIRGVAGGTVSIRTSNAELAGEFAQWGVVDAPGSYVRIDVSDNGSGMDRATQSRIFDPFFTTKEPGQGTGLGLATVFGIVKQSGGYVWVESEPGAGSTFSVYLPPARGTERTSGAFRAVTGGGKERILLVEDEDSVRRVARRALEIHGYVVTEAPDGPSALQRAQESEIDMVLTDVMMPGMLGPALVRALRSDRPDLPVLFMSGHTDEIVRDGLLDPATPFLPKPFTPAQLAQKVREVLDGAGEAAREIH